MLRKLLSKTGHALWWGSIYYRHSKIMISWVHLKSWVHVKINIRSAQIEHSHRIAFPWLFSDLALLWQLNPLVWVCETLCSNTPHYFINVMIIMLYPYMLVKNTIANNKNAFKNSLKILIVKKTKNAKNTNYIIIVKD